MPDRAPTRRRDGDDPLARGRDAYQRSRWPDAYRDLAAADRSQRLAGPDLWRLAVAALLVGRDEACLDALERACRSHQGEGEAEAAARCAFWLGFRLVDRGEVARASGWLARAQRLVESLGRPSGVEGWLLLPQVRMRVASGEADQAFALAQRATRIAEKVGDDDLHAIAVHAQGLARLGQLRVEEGLALLDEAMVAVTSDALAPIVTGIVYCSVISACRDVYALHRAHAWTEALTAWCERQPGLVPFAGACMVHRAEILQLHGAWEDAYREACRAEERCREAHDPPDVAAALYAQAELLRLQGRAADAERAYEAAAREGRDPQPGLALLRSSQGRHAAAAAALGRALEESPRPASRARLLAAAVEVRIAAGDVDAAAEALDEVEAIAAGHPVGALGTVAAHARGAVELARGDAAAALAPLREAWRGWQGLEAPYRAARVRELLADACARVGDDETAGVERDAARRAYRRLGAATDLARVERPPAPQHGLTPRELEVLRIVAAGGSNKAVAAELGLSVRTVERHLANIFAKLEVSSRSAATAFAYEHGLV